jgi:predicted XRE-type DNA-binding protein
MSSTRRGCGRIRNWRRRSNKAPTSWSGSASERQKSIRLKAQIVSEIYRLTNERKLTQAKAGKLMGITQPEVSRMFRGQFREYSVDRLMGFLTAFDRDVEIVVRPHKKGSKAARIRFSPMAA